MRSHPGCAKLLVNFPKALLFIPKIREVSEYIVPDIPYSIIGGLEQTSHANERLISTSGKC